MAEKEADTGDQHSRGHGVIRFLTFDEIVQIHKDQLSRYGGLEGYRNKSLIESAVESPKQTMFGLSVSDWRKPGIYRWE
jgi:hypothetical protein